MAAIVAVASMHFIWGLIFLTHDYVVASHWILWQLVGYHRAWIYLAASWIAAMSLFKPSWGRVALIPQQALLVVSAIAAVHSIALGAYPDGTLRPPLFILIDQLPILVLAIWHTWGLLRYHPMDWYQVR